MKLFDNLNRTEMDSICPNEGSFTYTNRSARPEAALVRDWLEGCYDNYAYNDRSNLRTRFRNPDDKVHEGAVFELIVHEALLASGCRILDVEAPLSDGKKPDFFVEDKNSRRFYVEAVVASGRSDKQLGAERRRNDVLAELEKISSPEWWLTLHYRGCPASQVNMQSTICDVEEWIKTLPSSDESKPQSFMRNLEGMRITVGTSLRKRKTKGGSTFGLISPGLHGYLPGDGIRQSLQHKARKYRSAEHPIILAVNAMCRSKRTGDFVSALFGTSNDALREDDDCFSFSENSRQSDGLWTTSGNRFKNGHISAIWAFSECDAWNTASRRPVVIPNPWASHCFDSSCLPTDQFNIDLEARTGEIVHGQSLESILGLPQGWPDQVK